MINEHRIVEILGRMADARKVLTGVGRSPSLGIQGSGVRYEQVTVSAVQLAIDLDIGFVIEREHGDYLYAMPGEK